MSCLPQSGGCERPFTDAFAMHLNHEEGAGYVHRACLDIADRRNPQPEALYVDPSRNAQLVVERKSLSWPIDFAQRHSNDHFVGDVFKEKTKDIPMEDDLYCLRLPMLMEGTQKELRPFAERIAERVRSHWSKVSAGLVLKGQFSDRLWWRFGKVPEWDRDEETPRTGLGFYYEGPATAWLDSFDPTNPPSELVTALTKIYAGCAKKFAAYPEARRVLILDLYEDLRNYDQAWWSEVLSISIPPALIGEVWSGVFDWTERGVLEWTFERIR